jgi:shikimate kinase
MSQPTSPRQQTANKAHIVLIGPSGSGKSTIAALVAERLQRDVIDTDIEIERSERAPITEIFAQRGEYAFRDAESRAVCEAVEHEACVIATGGGVVLRPQNRDYLWRRGLVFYLRASAETLTQRLLRQGADDRPLLEGDVSERIHAMLEARSAYYDLAHVTIDTDALDTETVAERIIESYARSS